MSGLLSAEIFISTGEWGEVKMPTMTVDNSQFQRSGSQEASLVMSYHNLGYIRDV